MQSDNGNHSTAVENASDGRTIDGHRLIVEFTVPTGDFLLASALSAEPEVIVEFEQLVPTDTAPLKFLWATNGDCAAFAESAAADPTVERITLVATFDSGVLYEVGWTGLNERHGLFEWLSGADATVLQSKAGDGEWLLKLRLPSREELGDLRTHCRENDIDFRLIRLYSLSEPKMGQFNVSEKQRAVLLTGLEMGYFEIPRESTLGEVAEALDISPNSASERLRRAQTNLLNNTLTIGQPTGIGIEPG